MLATECTEKTEKTVEKIIIDFQARI